MFNSSACSNIHVSVMNRFKTEMMFFFAFEDTGVATFMSM